MGFAVIVLINGYLMTRLVIASDASAALALINQYFDDYSGKYTVVGVNPLPSGVYYATATRLAEPVADGDIKLEPAADNGSK